MGNKLDKDYQKLLKDILNKNNKKGDRTGTGTLSVFRRQIRHDMMSGFTVLTSKKMAFKGVVAELIWFLQGRTDLKYLLDNNCNIWVGDAYKAYLKSFENVSVIDQYSYDTDPYTEQMFIEKIKGNEHFAKEWGDLGKIYGYQWRNWDGKIDQISNLINDLKNNPDSRRLLVNAWNPSDLDDMILPPCHFSFQCYTRELSTQERIDMATVFCFDKLPCQSEDWDDETLDRNNIPKRSISLGFYQRSADSALGIPFNIASYGLLLTILGRMCNMFPEELIGDFGDTHIYLNQIDGVKEQIKRTSFDLPRLIISDAVDFTGTIDDMLASCKIEDFKLDGYQSHPTIKFPLSN